MTIKAGLVTSLYSHDLLLFHFSGLLNRIIRKKLSLETGASLAYAQKASFLIACLR